MNEHVMPLSRAASGLLMQLTPRQSAIPRAAEIQGVVAVVIGMWLVFEFVRRELGHAFYGLIAMTLFGVTSTYYESVTWYSASFFTLALDATLLGLLAAQSYRRTRHLAALLACGGCCAVAPAFHSTALPAGVWCALYLMFVERSELQTSSPFPNRAAAAAVPLLGTVTFLALALGVSSGQVINASHYRGKTIVGAFSVREGIRNTLRTLADNQVPGALGIWHKSWIFPWPAVIVIVSALGLAAGFWWRVAPHRRLLVLGLALVIGSDLMVYGARADWSYDRSVHNWTRYHLFPHLGLVLFLIGGLPFFEGRLFHLVSGRLSRRQLSMVGVLIALSTACHWPRSHWSHFYVPSQIAVLQRVERVDAGCRRTGIDAATARAALGFLQFPLGYERDNAWDFLRGSPTPVSMTVDDARALLRSIQ
jgi:hypothetical protein